MPDVIVVGAGAAGCETAVRLSRSGADVLLLTTSLDTVYSAGRERVAIPMPEGTIGAELLAHLPVGEDGTVAAWEVHAQAKYLLEREERVHLMQSNVDALLVNPAHQVEGVATWEGLSYRCGAVALCVGPFLRGRLVSGATQENAGRPGEMAYDELADDLVSHGFDFVPEEHGGGGEEVPAWRGTFLRFASGKVKNSRVMGVSGLYASGQVVRGAVGFEAAARDAHAMVDAILDDRS